MESHKNSAQAQDDVMHKRQGHRRTATLGKSMPVTSLLLNFPPPIMRTSHMRSGSSAMFDEDPPLYFPVDDMQTTTTTSVPNKFARTKSISDNNDDEELSTDPEYDILVSECSTSNSRDGDSDKGCGEDEQVSLIGNSKFYTKCLTCTNSAPKDLGTRTSAINEMCRRLCTDECRLRLSLAGFIPPSESALKSQAALAKLVEESANMSEGEKQQREPSEIVHVQTVEVSGSSNDGQTTKDNINKPVFETVSKPILPPSTRIAIQRKKFLSDMLSISRDDSSDNDSNFVDEVKNNNESIEIVSTIVANPQTLNDASTISSNTAAAGSSNKETTTSSNEHTKENENGKVANDINVNDAAAAATIVDPHEIAMLKDFREKFEIAEALAKTSAMTSMKIKQRLQARKLEIELDNAAAVQRACLNDYVAEPPTADAAQPDKEGAAALTYVNAATKNSSGALTADVLTDVATCIDNNLKKANSLADSLATTKQNVNDYEPPRELLLYLVRMGSFNSAPKINNADSQDDDLEIPKGLNNNQLLQHVKHLHGEHRPPLLNRYFLKSSLAATQMQMVSNDITDGLRCLKLNSLSRECGASTTAPNHLRLMQWNILSQTLGQNNDGFVRCPEEALTWEHRKFLIVQEILQQNPDVVCLQEVDHFKFLQNILGSQNYEGIFFPKPDSPCLYIEENNGPDGCAIFFKRDKFELLNFVTRILEVWRVQSNQVAIAVNLREKSTGSEISICTTHLKARHGSLLSKLRNEQGRDLIRFVKQFVNERPLILCGDFNAEPSEPVYTTILNCDILNLSSAYADIRADDECNNNPDLADNAICDSVQKSMQCEPPYTTWKIREDGEECHTIDYVFYTKDQLKIKNCLDFPEGEEIGINRTPCFQYPSDHFSLVCDFEILPKSMKTKTQ